MSLSTVIRNVFSNWTSYLVSTLVSFALAPIVVNSLGNTGYGLWMLVISMTGYFGLLDLGIRSSVGRFVTRHLARDDHRGVNETVSTAFALLGAAGAAALLFTGAVAFWGFGAFKIEQELVSTGRMALLLTGLNMSLLLPLGVFNALLYGLERFDVVSGVTIVAEIVRAALVVWFLKHGYGLVALATILLAITLTQSAILAFFARKLYPPLRLSISAVNRERIAVLMGFSAYRFVWIVAGQMIFQSDALIIGMILGAGSITPFAIAASLLNTGRTVVSLVTDTLGPAAARMDAATDAAALRRLLLLGTTVALVVGLPVCLGFIFLGRQFITLWMGPEHADSALYLAILTIPQFTSMAQYASAFVLAGIARHKPLAYFMLAEAVANIVLSVILIRRFGLIGAAWGTVIPHLICSAIVIPIYTLRVVGMSWREYLMGGFLRPALCGVPVALLGFVLSSFPASGWAGFVARAGAMSVSFAVLAYFICLTAAQRAQLTGKVSSVLQGRVAVHGA